MLSWSYESCDVVLTCKTLRRSWQKAVEPQATRGGCCLFIIWPTSRLSISLISYATVSYTTNLWSQSTSTWHWTLWMIDDYGTCRKLGKSYFSASKLPYVCHCGHSFFYSSLKGCVSFVTRGVMDLLGMHDTDGPFQGQLDQLKSKIGVYIDFCGFSCWCSLNLKGVLETILFGWNGLVVTQNHSN